MKKYRFTLGALTAALMCCPLNALSYSGLGEIVSQKRDTIGDGLTYTEYKSIDQSGLSQNSYIFEYDPAGGVLPLISYGSTVYGKDRLGSMVSSAWSDQRPVFGALNGDFYSMTTGVPLGVMIEDGRLISTDDSKYALGFTADGRAVVGKPSVYMTLTDITRNGAALEIDQLNKFPTIWGVYMVTDEFASTTLSASESLEIVIELEGDIKVSGSVTGRVREVITDDCNTAIPEGCAVISIANTYEDYPLFTDIRVGDYVQLDTVCEPGWEQVVTAVGGGDLILSEGVMPEGIVDEAHEKVSNPRTAAGIRADGTVVFFAVDGRTESSRGLTLTELAAAMSELGCITALNLDGGGSTTVMVKGSTATECVYMNVPSDGSYRSLSNALLLVSRETSDGVPAALSALPNTPYVLRGSTVGFSALPLDRAYMPAGEVIGMDKLRLSFDPEESYAENVGSVSGAFFTAGLIPGEYRLKLATVDYPYELEGSASVVVVDKIDGLTVEPSYAKAAPGSLVTLNVNASVMGRNIISSPESFYYTLNGKHIPANQDDYPGAMLVCDVGYVTLDGNFQTFGNAEGEAEIGVWFDDFVCFVRVSVGLGSENVADFEDAAQIGDVAVSVGGSVSDVYFALAEGGYKSGGSLELGYTFANNAVERLIDVKLQEGYPISPDAVSIKLWIGGDVSGSMSALISDENGKQYELPYTVTKDYSRQLGWRELTAVIPDSLKTGTLTLKNLLSVNDLGRGTRRITIDNVTIYYGEPEISPLVGIDEHWSGEYLKRLYDMEVITDADCVSREDGLYYAPDAALNRGEFAKLLTRWLGINAANFEKLGVELEADTPADKLAYIRAAIAHGLMNGYGVDENGVTIFRADAAITRQEAFKVIGLLLDNDGALLKFADNAAIADWAYEGIAKCVASGAVRGYEDNTIRPQATISRAEMAAILARLG